MKRQSQRDIAHHWGARLLEAVAGVWSSSVLCPPESGGNLNWLRRWAMNLVRLAMECRCCGIDLAGHAEARVKEPIDREAWTLLHLVWKGATVDLVERDLKRRLKSMGGPPGAAEEALRSALQRLTRGLDSLPHRWLMGDPARLNRDFQSSPAFSEQALSLELARQGIEAAAERDLLSRKQIVRHGEPSGAGGNASLNSPATTPAKLLTPGQKALLNALKGRAMKVETLALEVSGGDASRLYRPPFNLKELKEFGLVAYQRNVGYFDPKRPPKDLVIDHPTTVEPGTKSVLKELDKKESKT